MERNKILTFSVSASRMRSTRSVSAGSTSQSWLMKQSGYRASSLNTKGGLVLMALISLASAVKNVLWEGKRDVGAI